MSCNLHLYDLSPFVIIIMYSLTARVVGAPQMISQPVSSIFPCSPLPSGTWRTPGLSIPWCCLPTSSSVWLVFFPLSLCLARWVWTDLMSGRHDHTTAICVSLRWPGGLRVVRLPAGTCMACILLRSSAVRVHDSQAYRKMDMTRELIGRIMGLREIPVTPNWFQPCHCCCCLCYPGEYLVFGTLISYNWA